MFGPLTRLSDDEQLFQQSVRDFAMAELAPLVADMDRREEFDPELLKKFFDFGLMGIAVPQEWGGAGGTFVHSILAVEELSRVDPSAGVICDVQNTLINNALLQRGTQEQKESYLPLLAREWVGAFALSESTSGSDAFALQTRADRAQEGYVLNGRKMWITNAGEADLFLIFATLDPALRHRGVCAFLVERDDVGLQVGRKEEKLGIRASSTCEVLLEDCRLPASRRLGGEVEGYRIAMETLNEGRIGIGAQMIGLAAGALERARAYALEREAFGRKISDFQAVRFALAEMSAELAACRLMVYEAARLRDSGEDFVSAAAQTKWLSSRAAEKIASRSLEVFGGYGFSKDYPMEKYFRDAKIGSIYEGTSHMQLETIARQMLS